MRSKLALALATGLVMGFTFMNIPSALGRLMELYDASYSSISVLMSALLWTHALIQIPAGILVDRYGLKRNLFFCLMAMSLGNLIPAINPSLGLAVAGRTVTGIGTALAFSTIFKMIALYAPPERIGSYQAFFGGFFSLGSIGAYLLIPGLLSYGWEWAYLTPGLSFLPLLAGSLFLDIERRPPARVSVAGLARVFRLRQVWVVGVYHSLSWGSVLALGNWVPSLLAEVEGGGATALQFAWGGALVMLISGIGRLSGGMILFRFRAALIANGSIVVLSVLFLSLFLIRQPLVVLILALGATWFASINFGAFFHLISRSTSQGSMATLLGMVNMLANLGAVAVTVMFGWLKDDLGSFNAGFLVLCATCLTTLMLGWRSLEK